MLELFNVIRLVAASYFLFVATPLRVASKPDPSAGPGSQWLDLADGFVRISVFFQLVVLLLGWLKLCLPGFVIGAWIIWIVASVLWFHRAQMWDWTPPAQSAILRVLNFMEKDDSSPARKGALHGLIWPSWYAAVFGLITLATLLERLSYPISNLRFATIDGYRRTLSLQLLTHGQPCAPDPTVAQLVPVMIFSGLDADAVVRLSGPLLALILPLAAAFCAFRLSQQAGAAVLSFGLAAVLPVLLHPSGPQEFASGEMAAIFWLLAIALAAERRLVASAAALVALLIHGPPSQAVLELSGCVLLAWAAARASSVVPRWGRSVVGGAGAVACIAVLWIGSSTRAADGPFQYEAAAKVCSGISHTFPRNDWMIVSPVQELGCIYGQGWHMELLDFVSQFRVEQVERPEFHFPYYVKDLFFFVETEPLSRREADGSAYLRSASLAQSMDPSIFGYEIPLGRASVQFAAASIVAAYARGHRDLSVYYKDGRLVVYRITKHS